MSNDSCPWHPPHVSATTALTAVVVPATDMVLVAFKNRSSDSDARVMVIVSPHSEVVNWDDGRATARSVSWMGVPQAPTAPA